MKDDKYTPPRYKETDFHCSHCNAYAHQVWHDYYIYLGYSSFFDDGYRKTNYICAICQHCTKHSIWLDEKMIYPHTSNASFASADMPNDIKEIYEEARQIASLSPRATAALLQVALEKLTEYLGETEGNLNTKIKNLKKQDLPEKVIQSADIVRVIGNESGAHAGTIDLTGKDNTETIHALFSLINIIVEQTITVPKKVDNMFNALPKEKRQEIENRDREQP